MNTQHKIFVIIAVLCIFFTTCINAGSGLRHDNQNSVSQSPNTPSVSPWRLVWQDEFDYTGLPDQEKWNYDVGTGSQYGLNGWGNNERQYYTQADSENVWVENGLLTITAKHTENQQTNEQFPSQIYEDYTSARLITKDRATWTYGRFEIRAKTAPGRGLWSAIWLLSANNPYGNWPMSGEIDIMEHVGFDPDHTHNAIHTQEYNHLRGTQVTGTHYLSDATTDFHTYALEWHSDKLLFFVNDVQTMEFRKSDPPNTAKWPFDHPFYLIINLAVGGNWGGLRGVDDNAFPTSMQVDFVRVYELRQ